MMMGTTGISKYVMNSMNDSAEDIEGGNRTARLRQASVTCTMFGLASQWHNAGPYPILPSGQYLIGRHHTSPVYRPEGRNTHDDLYTLGPTTPANTLPRDAPAGINHQYITGCRVEYHALRAAELTDKVSRE